MYIGGEYDCVVVGAGHAGCEAAHAAARMGCSVAIITQSLDSIALMPCNPAVGGPAKGHVVAEIDALGGLMGYATDMSFIQMRMLNTGKGPAVRALRAQADRRLYQAVMRSLLENTKGLRMIQAVVTEVVTEAGAVLGVRTNTGTVFYARAVIVTTGTYLEGRVIIGNSTVSSGPNGMLPSRGLSEKLRELGHTLGRFKTGTPPRIHRRSVDFSQMEEQLGDVNPAGFSTRSKREGARQLPCWLTYTTGETHQIIRSNLHRSPLYAGLIEGTGPRYCPSIEDKVVRFQDKERHQLFLEPEGYDTDEMYVQGFSTSLPEEVQVKMLQSVVGLKNAEIMRPGYAIEYDVVDPTELKLTLESKAIAGLFFAGQINGSSGYEEAAGQGLIAGANAAGLVRGLPAFVLRRSEAYLGVLVDDLVTKGTNEPYRLMTSRAEHRLLLRLDNVRSRLLRKGVEYGLVEASELVALEQEEEALNTWMSYLEKRSVPPDAGVYNLLLELGTTGLTQTTTAAALLRRPEVQWADLARVVEELSELPASLAVRTEVEIKYAGYIEKQREQVARYERMEGREIPPHVSFCELKGLSMEAREKLAKYRPQTVGQASRISGVSPADIAVLMVYLEGR